MRVIVDPRTDTVTVVFKESDVTESDEEKPGVILDYDERGDVVSLEILDASRRITGPLSVDFEMTS